MKRPRRITTWWKSLPDTIRRPLVFMAGMVLILVSPVIGTLPGPGGIVIFLAGIAVLASEFDWAEHFKEVIVKRVPAAVKRRWQPTPAWALTFDITSFVLLGVALYCYSKAVYLPVVSFTAAAITIAAFNRNRLERFKAWFNHKH